MLTVRTAVVAAAQQAGDRQVDVVPQAGAVPLHPSVGPLDPAIAGSDRGFGQQHDLSGETAPGRYGFDPRGHLIEMVVGDPDDHPGLVDQFGDDGAQHRLRFGGALPPRQFGQQLAGDGGADLDHALTLAGRPGRRARPAVSAALCTMYSSWSASRSSVADSRAVTAASAAALPLAKPSA